MCFISQDYMIRENFLRGSSALLDDSVNNLDEFRGMSKSKNSGDDECYLGSHGRNSKIRE